MSFLDKILASKRAELAQAKAATPLAELQRRAESAQPRRGFLAAMRRPGVRIASEIKRASPSKGDIRLDLDPAALAREYEAGGAAALSVLTEPAFFKGSAADLSSARNAVRIPVLRKDFIFDPYQVYETAAMGADAMLLIVRILDDERLGKLYGLARSLGLDVLVEVYDDADAARAKALGARLVGVNARDLSSFKVDLGHTASLAALFPPETTVMALSGICGPADILKMERAGIRQFLVGEAVVRDPALLPALVGAEGTGRVKVCGIRDAVTARLCAKLGFGAVGAVFYPRSPRAVTAAQAHEMFTGLPDGMARVGVFVDMPADAMAAIGREAGLTTIQCHGSEPPADLLAIQAAGFRVIKVLKHTGRELLHEAAALPDSVGILVECGSGALPGGNGCGWRWRDAAILAGTRPFALAGGLTPSDLPTAATESRAVAFDVSSGVESAPGVKAAALLEELAANARTSAVMEPRMNTNKHELSFWNG
jgi:indole-3-glycerol phosphate synthase/phosphoribosylanthranilate isomerase